MTYSARRARTAAATALAASLTAGTGCSQQRSPAGPPDAPAVFDTREHVIRLVTVADGLAFPWSLAFLPDGSLLVSERPGRLRIIREGVLDPTPIAGVPEVHAVRLDGLLDIALHPRFEDNGFVYLAYAKPGPPLAPGAETLAARISEPARQDATGRTKTVALARGRWDGTALVDTRDIFVADNWSDDSISQTSGSRIVFGRDGLLYLGMGAPVAPASSGVYANSRGGRAQDPGSHGGKVVRLRDDGSVPEDNPFVGRPGYRPELYTLGHRQPLGLTVHPETGEIWEHENGPADGDEINILKPGANYGWPVVGMGRDYSGDFIGGPDAIGPAGRADASHAYLAGMEQPFLFWAPAIAPSGMTFYDGDRFPNWRGNLFIGALKDRRLERHEFNAKGQPTGREYLLEDLNQRIRDVRQGPDGLLYVLTDADPGAVLRLEPAEP
jgi:glucose/arabinose dehydrogenase